MWNLVGMIQSPIIQVARAGIEIGACLLHSGVSVLDVHTIFRSHQQNAQLLNLVWIVEYSVN